VIRAVKWLTINYNLPSEPSRLRVSAWRNLKKLGAVNIQKSIWVLPYSDENYKALSEISEQLEHNNGDVLLMETSFPEEKYENRVIGYYNDARKIEYEEIIDKCEDFFIEIERETNRENFTFAEAEENEEELAKLMSWFHKIKARDIFQVPLRETTDSNLAKCKEVFEEFSNRVYENEK
jgi:CRISPR/Cas system-associated endoribonuclease Cas2